MLRALQPGILTSLVLISTTAAITIITAFIGYHLGRESLRGVSQPVVNPILGSAVNANDQSQGSDRPFLTRHRLLPKPKPALPK